MAPHVSVMGLNAVFLMTPPQPGQMISLGAFSFPTAMGGSFRCEDTGRNAWCAMEQDEPATGNGTVPYLAFSVTCILQRRNYPMSQIGEKETSGIQEMAFYRDEGDLSLNGRDI